MTIEVLTKAVSDAADAVQKMRGDFKGELTKLSERHEALATKFTELQQKALAGAPHNVGILNPNSMTVLPSSPVRQLFASDRFKAFQAGDLSSARLETKATIPLLCKTLLTSRENSPGSPTAGADVQQEQVAGIYNDPRRPLTILETIRREPIGQTNEVSYLSLTGWQPAAGIQAVEGGVKPEETYNLPALKALVLTFATTAKVSRQVLSDIPGLQAWLAGSLRYSVLTELEDHVVTVLLGGGEAYAPTADIFEDRIGQAAADMVAEGFTPSAILLGPVDFFGIASRRGSDGHYQAASGWAQQSAPIMWGVPVSVSAAMPAGTAIVLDREQGAVLWDREMLTLDLGYADDDFVKNVVRFRAELRACAAVTTAAGVKIVGSGSP